MNRAALALLLALAACTKHTRTDDGPPLSADSLPRGVVRLEQEATVREARARYDAVVRDELDCRPDAPAWGASSDDEYLVVGFLASCTTATQRQQLRLVLTHSARGVLLEQRIDRRKYDLPPPEPRPVARPAPRPPPREEPPPPPRRTGRIPPMEDPTFHGVVLPDGGVEGYYACPIGPAWRDGGAPPDLDVGEPSPEGDHLERTPRPAPVSPPPPPQVFGMLTLGALECGEGLELEPVAAFLRNRRQGLNACYEGQLRKNPKLRLTGTLRFSITPQGRTTGTTTSFDVPSPDLESCLKAVVGSWELPIGLVQKDTFIAVQVTFEPMS